MRYSTVYCPEKYDQCQIIWVMSMAINFIDNTQYNVMNMVFFLMGIGFLLKFKMLI